MKDINYISRKLDAIKHKNFNQEVSVHHRIQVNEDYTVDEQAAVYACMREKGNIKHAFEQGVGDTKYTKYIW